MKRCNRCASPWPRSTPPSATWGEVAAIYPKTYLPNYGVFDEERCFRAGERPIVLTWGDLIFGVNVCEDIWYPGGPTETQAFVGGAQLIINISASPYHAGKGRFRETMLGGADRRQYRHRRLLREHRRAHGGGRRPPLRLRRLSASSQPYGDPAELPTLGGEAVCRDQES